MLSPAETRMLEDGLPGADCQQNPGKSGFSSLRYVMAPVWCGASPYAQIHPSCKGRTEMSYYAKHWLTIAGVVAALWLVAASNLLLSS